MSEKSQREYARVQCEMPVRVRQLQAAELEKLAHRLHSEPTRQHAIAIGPTSPSDPWEKSALKAILSRLDEIEGRIEQLAEGLDVDITDGVEWIEGETVDISGNGVGVCLAKSFPDGEKVELELTLYGDPTVTLRCVARVVQIVPPDGVEIPVGRVHMGLAFDTMNEEDRQIVVRYTFKLQRDEIREAKELVRDSRD